MKKNMKIRKRFACFALTVTILAVTPETVFASQPENEAPPDPPTVQETLPPSEEDAGGQANGVPMQTSQPASQNGLLAPVIKRASYSAKGKKKITIKWSKVKGAKGYHIYRSASANGKYKKIKTIKSGKTLSYKNTGIKSGKTYYYKVRAYKMVKKSRKAGPFSEARSCSTGRAGTGAGTGIGTGIGADASVDVASSGYTLYVNKKTNVVTVYSKKGTPIKSFICSTGKATPVGTFYTKAKYRWHALIGNCYGQWDTRIVGGILFHSVFYLQKNNNHTLSVSAYNKLGTTASHGCVRLTAEDAKWIYDNCKLKTKVVIINNSSKSPLGKPKAYKLPGWHTWDPTDPNCRSKCKAKGCH